MVELTEEQREQLHTAFGDFRDRVDEILAEEHKTDFNIDAIIDEVKKIDE